MSRVFVIDYGMSNLGSVRRSLEECGADVVVSDDPSELKSAVKILLPGVGSFADGMRNLRDRGWIEPLENAALKDGIPVLGICLGMQLLFESGEEGSGARGLGLLPGRVRRLAGGQAVPHVGWNRARSTEAGRPLLGEGADFYFVHSFIAEPGADCVVLARTLHGEEFPSAVAGDRAIGFQFHPEKSGRDGLHLLAAALERLAGERG